MPHRVHRPADQRYERRLIGIAERRVRARDHEIELVAVIAVARARCGENGELDGRDRRDPPRESATPDHTTSLPCDDSAVDEVRIDKWLWAARFFKTRSLATEAVAGGKVHVNDARVKPARELRLGDTVDITIGGLRRTVVVQGLAEKRGPAATAQALYAETPESVERREQHIAERKLARPLGADLGARPTKLDRRRLEALRRAQRRTH